MAQEVKIILVDDLDGGSADETVRFGMDSSSYEIDLSSKNAAALRDALKPFIAARRKIPSRRARAGKPTASSTRSQDASAIAVECSLRSSRPTRPPTGDNGRPVP